METIQLTPVTHPLKLQMKRQEVAHLHEALGYLGFSIDTEERDIQRFGASTRAAVIGFQEANKLEPTGVVDQKTAGAMNKVLLDRGVFEPGPAGDGPVLDPADDAEGFFVRGEVVKPDGTPMQHLSVRALDRVLCTWRPLGQAKTDPNGRYEIRYDRHQLDAVGKKRADLKVEVYDTSGDALMASSPLFLLADREQRVDFSIGETPYVGRSEFARVREELAPVMQQVEDPTCLDATDVLLIGRQVDVPTMRIAYYVRATRWGIDQKLAPEVFYGLLRQDTTLELGAVYAKPFETLWKRLNQAVAKNVVDLNLDAALMARLSDAQQAYLSDEAHPYRRLLKTTGLDDARQKVFSDRLMKPVEEGETLWSALVKKDGFTEEEIADLQAMFEVQSFTGDNAPLAVHLRGDRKIASPREVAVYSMEVWRDEILTTKGIEIPEWILPGGKPEQRREAYAIQLAGVAEMQYPTASLRGQMQRDAAWSKLPFVQLFENYPNFEFEKQRVVDFLQTNEKALDVFPDPEAGRRDLLRLEQLFHLTPASSRLTIIKPLWGAGLTSAPQIAAFGRQHLKRNLNGRLGAKTVDRMYRRSVHVTAVALQLYMRYNPQLNGMALPVMRSTNVQDERQLAVAAVDLPEWEELFGSADSCACAHCESAISPAAYLVDIMDFLDRAVDASGKTGLEHLLDRRPDLGRLRLTCENAETTLPHIDIVNEILEQLVAYSAGLDIPAAYSAETTWDAEALQAQPQYLEPAAYEVLREAVYPFELPFDLWLVEGRRYLEQMGVSRSALIRAAPVQEGGALAAEELGMSPAERDLITSPPLNPQALEEAWGLDAGPVGVKLAQVDRLLDQAGIEYDALLRLLNTRFLNPDRTVVVWFDGDSCSLDKARLAGETGTPLPAARARSFFDRLHRFIRLQRRTGWREYDLDRVLRAAGITDLHAAGALAKLSVVYRFAAEYRLTLEELCSWWQDLDTYAYETDLASSYEAVFLDPVVLPDTHAGAGPDLRNDVFALSPDRSDIALTTSATLNGYLVELIEADDPYYVLNADYSPVVQAATGLSAEELLYLASHVLPADADGHIVMDLALLSTIYRIASFTRALSMDISDYERLAKLLGYTPLQEEAPARTVEYTNAYTQIDEAGWPVDLLAYLLSNEAEAAVIYAPPADDVDANLQAWSLPFAGVEDTLEAVAAAKDDPTRRSAAIPSIADALGLDLTVFEGLVFTHRPELGDEMLERLILTANPGITVITPAEFYPLFETLNAFALAWNRLDLDPVHLAFMLTDGAAMGWLDLSALPQESGSYEAWSRLTDAAALQAAWFEVSPSLFDLLGDVRQGLLTGDDMLVRTSEWTGWSLSDLRFLAGPESFAWDAAAYGEERWLLQAQAVLDLARAMSVSAAQIHAWAGPDLAYDQMMSIKQALRLAYDDASWTDVLASIQDPLRNSRRDALLGYLMHREGLKDSTAFFDHFLIDPDRDACENTSRTVEAHAAVQHLVQRILLNLEQPLQFAREDAEGWSWRKNYRVWEAGRKIFLYPENWLEAELRDNTSVFFDELVDELSQEDLTQEYAERVFESYLHKLHQVSRLEIMGMYEEVDEARDVKTLHVFGRTQNIPQSYWYRRREDEARWTPWERVELDIQGEHLVPVVYQGRLHLFWPILEFSDLEVEPTGTDKETSQAIDDLREQIDQVEDRIRQIEDELTSGQTFDKETNSLQALADELFELENEVLPDLKDDLEELEKAEPEEIAPPDRYEVTASLAWSQYFDGRWTAKRVAASTGTYRTHYEPRKHFVTGWVSSTDRLYVAVYANTVGSGYDVPSPEYAGHFYLDDCSGEMVFSRTEPTTPEAEVTVGKSLQWYNTLIWGSPTYSQEFMELEVGGPDDARRLVETGGTLHYAHQYGPGGNEDTPFFFSHEQRVYFVRVSSQFAGLADYPILYKDILTDLPSLRTAALTSGGDFAYEANNHYTGLSEDIVVRDVTGVSTDYHSTNIDVINDVLQNGVATFDVPDVVLEQVDHVSNSEALYVFTRFYHPHSCLFLKQLRRYGVEGLLNPDPAWDEDSENLYRQMTPLVTFDFDDTYDPNSRWVSQNSNSEAVADVIDFDHDSAYGSYNWEVFYHIPLLIATRMMQNRRFDEARRWFNYIFDPLHTDGEAPARYWKIKPFYNEQLKGPSDDAQDLVDLFESGSLELERQVEAWEKDPFNPHVMARIRIGAYMRTTVMKYLDCLIAEADALFAMDTREAITEALQLYLLASEVLGERPATLPAKASEPMTPDELLGRITLLLRDPLEPLTSRVSVDLGGVDISTPALADGVKTITVRGATSDYVTLLRFCLPANDMLLGYWDTVADRLFKIRHCMNLAGQVRELPLFAPPIDPALLVRASAAGLDIASILQSLYAPLPHYRFDVLLRKALEFCSDVRGFGGALLSALEKRDAEELSQLRSSHETALLKVVRAVKEKAVEEAQAAIDGLQKSKESAEYRAEYYVGKERVSANEQKSLTALGVSTALQFAAQQMDMIANLNFLIPDVSISAGLCTPCTTTRFGGNNLGPSIRAFAAGLNSLAGVHSYESSRLSTVAGYDRRMEEWQHQAELARREVEQLDQQILGAEIRLQLAEQDLANHDTQIEQAEGIAEFLKLKFSNQALYSWMVSKVSGLHFTAYQLALQLARQAERAFQHELGGDAQRESFIQTSYWDSLKKGLTAGDQLTLDLRRMESAYLDLNKREFELNKHVSLRQLAPEALLALKASGTCEVTLPEWLFDLDTPGHYMRRIKNVSLSIPSVTGPYTGINCTLTLTKSTVRTSALLLNGEYVRDGDDTGRFVDTNHVGQSIVTSAGNNDSGLFETNLRDERYLPFEGAGAESTWTLELPADYRAFDYNSITDVILHVRYTSRQGGALLRDGAVAALDAMFDDASELELPLLLSLKHDFPTEWRRFVAGDEDFSATVRRDHFPYITQGRAIELKRIQLYSIDEDELVALDTNENLTNESNALEDDGQFDVRFSESILSRDVGTQAFVVIGYRVAS